MEIAPQLEHTRLAFGFGPGASVAVDYFLGLYPEAEVISPTAPIRSAALNIQYAATMGSITVNDLVGCISMVFGYRPAELNVWVEKCLIPHLQRDGAGEVGDLEHGLLQLLENDLPRVYGANVWIDYIKRRIEDMVAKRPKAMIFVYDIYDVAEVNMLRGLGFKIIAVMRPDARSTGIAWDYTVNNNDNMADFQYELDMLAKKLAEPPQSSCMGHLIDAYRRPHRSVLNYLVDKFSSMSLYGAARHPLHRHGEA